MAPKIYHLHPLVAGRLSEWPGHFARCGAMGFDTVCVAPPFVPGAGGDIFITGDHESLHPALGWQGSADDGIARITHAASAQGLRIWLDLAIDRVAIDAVIRQREAQWFSTGGCGALPNPRRTPYRLDVAYARLEQTEIAEAMTAWWLDRLVRLVRAGVAGFRCLEPDRVPPPLWRQIIGAIRTQAPQCRFLAWTPDVERPALPRLEGVGFDYVCSSLAWWDGRGSWFVDEAEALRRIAPAIASPEPSFLDRRAARLEAGSDTATACRLALRLAAVSASGILVPMGFEYATRRAFDAARAGPEDFDRARDEAPADLSDDLWAANAFVDRVAALGRRWRDAVVDRPAGPRDGSAACRYARCQGGDRGRWSCWPIPISAAARRSSCRCRRCRRRRGPHSRCRSRSMRRTWRRRWLPGRGPRARLCPERPGGSPGRRRQRPRSPDAVATRIAIEALAPSVPYGNLAVKRLVGEPVIGDRRYHRRWPRIARRRASLARR